MFAWLDKSRELAWLVDTFLYNAGPLPTYGSAVMYGRPDLPHTIELWRERKPKTTDRPVAVFERSADDGLYRRMEEFVGRVA